MKLFSLSRPLAGIAALGAAGCGLFVLIVWEFGQWHLGSFGPDYIPMAPLTALLFVGLGSALAAQVRWPESRIACFTGRLGAGLAIATCALVLLQSWHGFPLPWDHWLLASSVKVGEIPVGRMSLLTALAFGLTAFALLARCTRFAGRPSLDAAATVSAGVGLAIGLVVSLGYAVGTPLLYGGATVPMALLTALDFIVLNTALMMVGPMDRLLRVWHTHDHETHVPEAHRTFTRRLALTVTAIGALIMLAGFLYLRSEQAAARQTVYAQLEAIANLKVEEINSWRNERLGEARFLLRTPAVIRDIAAFVAAPDDAAARARVRDWLDPIKAGDRYASLTVLDAQARPLLSIPDAPDPMSEVAPDLFAAAVHSEDPVFTDIQYEAGGTAPHLNLLVSIRATPKAAPVAVIVLCLDPRSFLFPLIQSWPLPSTTAESLLVRREGDEIVYLNKVRHQPDGFLTMRRSIHDPILPAAMAGRAEVGVHEGVDYRGIPVLSAIYRVHDTPWMLVAKMDQAEAYAPIQHDLWQTALLVGLLLLAVVLAAIVMWRQRHAATLRRALGAEQESKALAERLGLVMRHANDCILIMEESGRIREANDRAISTYGYTLDELRALPPGGLRPPAAIADLTRQFSLFHSPAGAVFETVHRRKDGTVFPVEISGSTVVMEGRPHILGIYRDITERKRLTDEVARREAQFRAVFDHAPVGMSLTSEGRLQLVNAEHARITGVPMEKSTEPGIFARVSHPADYARQSALAEKFIRGEIDHYTVEKRYLHPDGRVQWAELTSRFFAGPFTSERWIVTTVTDIAERKAHEREIERLNRMYFVISQVNQGIVRAKSTDALFPEICRVLVEFGRFKLAWVGWEDRAAQLIRPVAVAGDEHGYVSVIRISSDPGSPEGRGPTGTAFREGRTCVCNDFFGDPALQPWHEEARTSGFQSSIALPLREDGAIRGVLTVYADEKNFFGPREIALLEESAGDLAFALDVLAGHKRREAAETALQRSKEDFSRAFLSSPTAVCINALADGRYLDVNAAWERLAGYRREEVIGRTTLEMRVWDDEQDREEVRRMIAAKQRVANRELRFRSKEGALLDTLLSLEVIDFGGEPCLISTIIDISRERQAQQKLTEQIAELSRWHEATLGREERILDLKREVNELLARTGVPARYPSAQPGNEAADA